MTLLVLLVAGCAKSSKPVYSYYEHLDGSSWRTDRELFYTFPAAAGESYHVEGELRVSPDFSLRQLPIGVVFESPSHDFQTSRLTVPVGDRSIPTSGYVLRENSFVIDDHFIPSETGDYTISLRSLLRDSVVQGVVEVGVIVTPR